MHPVCCFFGEIPEFSTEYEIQSFYLALEYQIEKIIKSEIYAFNTCMLRGLDIWCASYIGKKINAYREAAKGTYPTEYAHLCININHAPCDPFIMPDDVKMRMVILRAASSVRNPSVRSMGTSIKQAIRSSTHMLAVYSKGDKPSPVLYAEEKGLTIFRFTPEELIASYSGLQE